MKKILFILALGLSFSVASLFNHNILADSSTDNAGLGVPALRDGRADANPQENLRPVSEEFDPDEPIAVSELFPGKPGSRYTYIRSDGGITQVTLGSKELCDERCIQVVAVRKPAPIAVNVAPLRFPSPGKTEIFLLLNDDGLFFVRYLLPSGAYTEYCPPMEMLPAEVSLGDRFEYSHSGNPCIDENGEPCGNYDGDGKYMVNGALEDVTVPAGAFPNCLRLTREYFFENRVTKGFGYITEETWHARGVGVVKRFYKEKIHTWADFGARGPRPLAVSDYEETLELTAYHLVK